MSRDYRTHTRREAYGYSALCTKGAGAGAGTSPAKVHSHRVYEFKKMH